MPIAFRTEFREDVIRVYRESDASLAQVAKDFGISPSCLKRWSRSMTAARPDPCRAPRPRRSPMHCGRRTRASNCLNKKLRCCVGRRPTCRKRTCRKMKYPLVCELAADGIPVAVTCRVLQFARQPYYRWLKNPVTAAERRAAYRANALFDAHRDDPEFGYRFLVDEAKDAGEAMAERTAWKICSERGWWSVFGKKRGRNGKKPGPPVHDDRVQRAFTPQAPNRLWLADITEHAKTHAWAFTWSWLTVSPSVLGTV